MKLQLITALLAGAFLAGAQDGNSGGTAAPQNFNRPPVTVSSTTTTTTVTTTSGENNTKETTTTVTTTTTESKEVSPEDGGYTYVEYEGTWVPYYKGYYYINGVWLWRRPGKPPFPPPHFRPVPRHKPLPKPAPKPASKPVPAKAAPVKKSAPHVKVPAPAVPHR